MLILLTVVVSIAIMIIVVLNLPVFGKHPKGARLEKIKRLSLHKDGLLHNQSPTPNFPPDVTIWKVLNAMIKGNRNATPPSIIPTATPDFKSSIPLKITWFGHSTYLLQVDQVNILVDPIFSETPSPFQFLGGKNFKGTNFIDPEDLPDLDIILITHDHYDHLDYLTIKKLRSKTKKFVTSLGVAEHLIYWGIQSEAITELSWNEVAVPVPGFSFTALPARHFSGRTFKRNQSLWSSFILQTEKYKLYLGGDSGYDQHFKQIGEEHGPFDLAILECGQYNKMWPLIHMFPEQVVRASQDLNAKILFPVHWGKFKLALHDWDEPIKNVVAEAESESVKIITPLIGETFLLESSLPNFKWWIDLSLSK